MTTVLIADDQEIVRDGLRMILESQDDLSVVGEAADGHEAVALARELAPDVILMDISMPRLDGIRATAIVTAAAPGSRVLVLTTFGEDEHVYEALKAGASGFLLKDSGRQHLLQAIRVLAHGGELLDPTITRRLIERSTRRPPLVDGVPGPMGVLTERELEVTELIARGLSNAEIAATLYVAEPTVKSHVAAVLRKLGHRDRVQVVIAAYESGLVEPGQA